jgi:hypothetical protein
MPITPNRSVPMAIWGGSPRRMSVGMVIRLAPPIKVPKALAPAAAMKMMIRPGISTTRPTKDRVIGQQKYFERPEETWNEGGG